MGPARKSGTRVSQREKRAYRQGKVEVVYVEGRANWIKLYDTSGLRFSQASLSMLGLPAKRPTYVNRNHVMGWNKICNLKEVSFYADGSGGVSSVLVCVRAVLHPPSHLYCERAGALEFCTGLRGNPVGIRGCPAAVSENDTHQKHWRKTPGSGGQ